MSDWDEVKRLAADFQKVQLSSSLQKLSERNCIEIVTWLIEKKLIDVIFTTDGKEYITPKHLLQEIEGELFVHGGRVNLAEISKSVGVDFSHVAAQTNELLKTHKNIYLILGQLIDSSYIARVAGEINEKLQQQGQISVNDLTIQYDLPADFIQKNIIEKQLGKIIQGKQGTTDSRVYFTEAFIERCKCKIRGALCGLTKPTPITALLSNIGLPEKLFFSLFDPSFVYGTLTSRMAGGQYISHMYTKFQNDWVQNFYKQNGYLEYDTIAQLGISDYKNYLKRNITDDPLVLNSCIASKRILSQVDGDIEECIASKSYVDVKTSLPSVFSEEDVKIIIDKILTPQRQRVTVIFDSFILSTEFLESIKSLCDDLVKEKAEKVVESGQYQQYLIGIQAPTSKASKEKETFIHEDVKVDKREERRKKAVGGKAGGGAQGRETKTKSSQKKSNRNVKNLQDDDDYSTETKHVSRTLEILNCNEIVETITPKLREECLEELIDEIAAYLEPVLNEKGLEMASTLFASTVTNRTASRRQTHNELQDRMNTVLSDIRLYDKGIKLLSSDVQMQLYKYLLKTFCTDIVNGILNYLSSEHGLSHNTDGYTNEQRLKLVNEFPNEYKSVLQTTIKSLSADGIEDFMNIVEECFGTCSIIIKKVDKKKDRQLILGHKHSLLEQLAKCDDPALVLHMVVVLIFIIATQNVIHCSGKHVINILTFLKSHLMPEDYTELSAYHDMIILSKSSDVDAIKEKLQEKLETIKKIAYDYKKPSTAEKTT